MKIAVKVKILIAFLGALPFSIISVFAQYRVIPTDTSNVTTLHIDPSNAMGGKVSDFFDDVKYIPLETTPESIFGAVEQLEVTDDYFIVLDNNTDCVLLFEKNGKFHAKIKGIKRQFGSSINSFFVNRWTKQIVLSNDSYRTISYYDFDGKLINNQNMSKSDKRPTNFKFVGPDNLINCDMFRDEDAKSQYFKPFTRSLIQYVQGMNTVYASGLNYTELEGKRSTTHRGVGPITYFGNDTTLFYSEYFNYRVDVLTPHTIKRAYQLVFPMVMSLPHDFNTNPAYLNILSDYTNEHKELIYCISNFYKVGDNLLFEAGTSNYDNNKEEKLIYNLKSRNLIAYFHISPDESTSFLPLYDVQSYDFNTNGIMACDGKNIYASIASITMFKADGDNKAAGKKPAYNTVLSNYFNKGTKKDNPIIVQAKLKKQL